MSMKPYAQPGNNIKTQEIRRVLIIKLTSLGDVVHALPVAAGLKKAFPLWELHWVVEDRCAPLLENHPLLESVIIYPRQKIQSLLMNRKWGQALKILLDLRRTLRRLDIDLSIDLQGLAKSGLMALLAWAPRRIGCFGLKEISYWISKGLAEGGDLHAVDRNLKVAQFLGVPVEAAEFVIGLTEDEKKWAASFLKQRGVSEKAGLVGLQVGASLPQKCWPVQKWPALMERFRQRLDLRVVLFGDQTDRERLKPYQSEIPPQVINTIGELSLRQLAALIDQCGLFVGADTGPLHLAVGLGLPVVALYGADDPQWTGPYGAWHRIHYKKLPCSPCNKNPVCQGRYDCLEAISVDEVMDSVEALLKGSEWRVRPSQ